MPLQVSEIDTLKTYIEGVMNRADHHAGKVEGVALTLAGAIVWKKDDDDIKVMVIEGDTKNVLWVKFGGKQFAFSYNHKAQCIEMRKGTTQGETIASFTNESSYSEIIGIFDRLKPTKRSAA